MIFSPDPTLINFKRKRLSTNYNFVFVANQLFLIKWLIFVARGCWVTKQRRSRSNDTLGSNTFSDWSVTRREASDWSNFRIQLRLRVSRNEEISLELFITEDLAHTSHSSFITNKYHNAWRDLGHPPQMFLISILYFCFNPFINKMLNIK